MTLADIVSHFGGLRPSEWLGYFAAALVFATFYTKTMVPLRIVAIASNFLFIAYGYLHPAYPVLVLHVALLPLNIWRLRQMLTLVREVCAGLGERATLHVVEGADHSFGVLKRSGRTGSEVLDELADTIAGWARRV